MSGKTVTYPAVFGDKIFIIKELFLHNKMASMWPIELEESRRTNGNMVSAPVQLLKYITNKRTSPYSKMSDAILVKLIKAKNKEAKEEFILRKKKK